jgi:A/G-specific adenine glycosylase
MLQQTRIASVIPYYERFLTRFPSIRSLACASESAVLKLWSGLGYYSRARNLRLAAKQIVARHGSKFPRELQAVRALPGIGPYTAAAVLSIAWNVPLVSLDGNIARVFARILGIRKDIREPKRWLALGRATDALLDRKRPGDWNQAIMELGETICTPRAPLCPRCPLAGFCEARRIGLTDKIPPPRTRRTPVKVSIAAAVLLDEQNRTLLVREPGLHDPVLFSRLWQFPSVEFREGAQSGATAVASVSARLARHLSADLHLPRLRLVPLATARHAVTFRSITLAPFLARTPALTIPVGAMMRLVSLRSIHKLPVSAATRKIAAAGLTALDHIAKGSRSASSGR